MLLVAACVVVAACSDSQSSKATSSSTSRAPYSSMSTPPNPPRTWEQIRDQFDCHDLVWTDEPPAPIRGLAATHGMQCQVQGASVHVFERTPADDKATAVNGGGSVENIERLVGAGQKTPGCDIQLLITDKYFALAAKTGTLDFLSSKALGTPAAAVAPATPTVSYLGPNCDLGNA